MNYTVIVPKSVRKNIFKLPLHISDSIFSHLNALKQNPRSLGNVKLQGGEGWRIRIGDYRIIYDIDDDRKIVIV